MLGIVGPPMRTGWASAPRPPRARADANAGVMPLSPSYGPMPGWPLTLTSGFAYDSDSLTSAEFGAWNPWLRSPDSEVNLYRDRRTARGRAIVRNDGWATGAVNRIADNTIGSLFRLVARPDWRALQRAAPGVAFDDTWSNEFEQAIESEWRLWAEDPGFFCDAEQRLSMVQTFRLALRHKVIDGESLLVLPWMPERIGSGAARYATTVQSVDPDRLSNQYDGPDTHTLRGGVELDGNGAPVAYHIRRAHQNDMFDATLAVQWDRVPRRTDWGRPIVVHDFDPDRAGQHRGVGLFNPVLNRLKMLGRYDAAELQQALLQTVIGTFIVSPYDSTMIANSIDAAGDPNSFEPGAFQSLRSQFYGGNSVLMGDVRIPTLAPGDRIDSVPPRAPTSNFGEFEHAILRAIASATGTTAEQVTQDYSRANYSSLRASMLESWRTHEPPAV